MPKKSVIVYLLFALLGAALFIYFTFPRSKDEIPQSNNQRPYPSSPGPNGVPVPESVPHPSLPTTPGGPHLRVMAWASPTEAPILQAEADAYAAATGQQASLQIDGDEASYRRDLQQALATHAAPDVCLVSARDFSGLDPVHDLVPMTAGPENAAPRSLAAFTVTDQLRAMPDEFSVDMLFYNARQFDEAGIAYPDRHWTWDIMEAISRALVSLKLKNEAGDPVYALELPANFDFWNILCTQDGHPALDRSDWHLADSEGKDSRMRGLDLIHEFFRDLSVTAPADQASAPGRFFAKQRASLLIAPSELEASLPPFRHGMTLLPSDLSRASLARVNGWAVPAGSAQPEAAKALAAYLSQKPLHRGWTSVMQREDDQNLCYEALSQSLLPRIVPKTEHLAHLLDQQIALFASAPDETTSENLYAQIEGEYETNFGSATQAASPASMNPKADAPQLRGL